MVRRSRRRPPAQCACGQTYDEFRTFQTFASIRQMMRDDPHPEHGGWRQKRRRGVLGYWREYKINLFYLVHGYCESLLSSSEDSGSTLEGDISDRLRS